VVLSLDEKIQIQALDPNPAGPRQSNCLWLSAGVGRDHRFASAVLDVLADRVGVMGFGSERLLGRAVDLFH
jgi:hypothetical protein